MYVLVFFFVVLLVYYAKYRKSRKAFYDLSDALPDAGGLPILGQSHWFIGGPEAIYNNVRTLYSKLAETADLTKIWIGPQLYIVSSDLDDIQKILENCLEKDYTYKFLRTWLGNGLFVASVDQWKLHRRLLLPVFHNRLAEDYVEVFGEQAAVLVDRLNEHAGKDEFDVYEYITSCMLDIVFGKTIRVVKLLSRVQQFHHADAITYARCARAIYALEAAMGEKMDVQHNPDTPYLRARKAVISIISMRMFKPWMQPDPLFNLTSHSTLQREGIDLTHHFTDEVVAKKRIMIENNNCEKKKDRKDILELLLAKNANFTNVQLREHIDSITIAGNDTTALVIAYTLMMLGIHQSVQEKVYQEIKSVFGDSMRSATKEDINKLEYLERVIKETMRLYTVVPILARTTQRELKLSTCTIPAGVGCSVLPFMLHRSPKIWGADADQFCPDRFLSENCVGRHPCAYLPFSYGIRNCIGRHFGMLAMKSIIATVVRNYEITAKPFERMKIEILLFPADGNLISIKKRA